MADPEKEVVEEKTETQVSDELFTEGFEAAISEASAGSETTTEKKVEEKPPEEKKEEKVVEPKPDEITKRVETLEKSLEDTKKWGTERATEAANLKKEIEALKAKTPEPEPEPSDEIKQLYEDYPEFKKAVEFEVKRLVKQGGGTGGPAPEIQNKVIGEMINGLSQISFAQGIMFGVEDGPEDNRKWVDGHPDGIKIIRSKEFKDWIEKEKIDTTTEEFNNPLKAIEVISKFKEAKVKGALNAHDKETALEKKEKREAAGATVSTTKGGRTGGGVDKDDYDGAFAEAVRS